MLHTINLQPSFYDYLTNGTKRIELRLYDEKRKRIKLGDIIEFYKDDNNRIQTKVIGLLRYNNFKDLFNDFDISILADASMTKDQLMNTLNKFYTPEKQVELGVIGIRIEII